MLTMIAAMSRGRVIGQKGALPWGHGSMKRDQDRFRQIIDGQIIAIGGSTFNPEDDYIRRARHVYLLTNKAAVSTDKITVCRSLRPIIEAARQQEILLSAGPWFLKS